MPEQINPGPTMPGTIDVADWASQPPDVAPLWARLVVGATVVGFFGVFLGWPLWALVTS